jgi:undecaprenyl diphosphate synthase
MRNGNGQHLAAGKQAPKHVAIIMDGSGRWAVTRGLPRAEGHRAGRGAVRCNVTAARNLGVRVLTLFTFSTDNWARPQSEVAELMDTFEDFFRVDAPGLISQGIRLSVTGRRDRLSASLRGLIDEIETAGNAAAPLHVRFAIDYSGRESILHAARRFAVSADDSAESFSRTLAEVEGAVTPTPDVDLLIRTGGELRLSNCPLWEIAYAELYFTDCLWPDFGPAELDAALQEFAARDRRFGRVTV